MEQVRCLRLVVSVWFLATGSDHLMIEAAVANAVAPLKARIMELEAEVARLKKDSSTSSKPPSSDIVKAARPPRCVSARERCRCRREKGELDLHVK